MAAVKLSQSYDVSKAREYGVEGYPAALRDALIAIRMTKAKGARVALRHARIVAMGRLHYQLVDRKRAALLPKPLAGETVLEGMTLCTLGDDEARAAKNCSAIPSKTFHWAMAAAGINPKLYHFVDIGSGWGYAVLLAAEYPFQGVTGIEFASELHQEACANVAWVRQQGLVKSQSLEVRNESALTCELPDGPILLFLNNPFGQTTMRLFLDRIDRSFRSNPRSIVAIYVNPHYRHLFGRPRVRELPLSGRHALLLRVCSPFQVCAFAWGE